MNEEVAECLERLGPEEEQEEEHIEEHVEESEISEMALELGAEEVIDVSSLDAAPMMLDAALPMDTSPEGEDEDIIEPIDLEMPKVSDEAGLDIEPIELETPVFGESTVSTDDAVEPLEIVTEEAEAISLVASGDDDDDSGGGGQDQCTITFLLGEDDPRVDTIRQFRDEILAESSAGRKLIDTYYRNTSMMVEILDKSPAGKAFAKKVLEFTVIPGIQLIIK